MRRTRRNETHLPFPRYPRASSVLLREDSCCEFFVAPAAESDARTSYINFEINAAGTMLAYHCVPGSETQALSITDAA